MLETFAIRVTGGSGVQPNHHQCTLHSFTFTFRSKLDSRIKTGLHVFGAQEESGEKTDTGRVPHLQTSTVLFG